MLLCTSLHKGFPEKFCFLIVHSLTPFACICYIYTPIIIYINNQSPLVKPEIA